MNSYQVRLHREEEYDVEAKSEEDAKLKAIAESNRENGVAIGWDWADVKLIDEDGVIDLSEKIHNDRIIFAGWDKKHISLFKKHYQIHYRGEDPDSDYHSILCILLGDIYKSPSLEDIKHKVKEILDAEGFTENIVVTDGDDVCPITACEEYVIMKAIMLDNGYGVAYGTKSELESNEMPNAVWDLKEISNDKVSLSRKKGIPDDETAYNDFFSRLKEQMNLNENIKIKYNYIIS